MAQAGYRKSLLPRHSLTHGSRALFSKYPPPCILPISLTNHTPSSRPHLLPPQSLYLAHLAPYLTSTQTQLQNELQALQTENETLAKGIEGQRVEVGRLVGGLEAVIRDLEEANGVMEGVEVGRGETLEVEGEVGGRRGRGSRL